MTAVTPPEAAQMAATAPKPSSVTFCCSPSWRILSPMISVTAPGATRPSSCTSRSASAGSMTTLASATRNSTNGNSERTP